MGSVLVYLATQPPPCPDTDLPTASKQPQGSSARPLQSVPDAVWEQNPPPGLSPWPRPHLPASAPLHGGVAKLCPLPRPGRGRGSGKRASARCPLVHNDPIHGLGGTFGRETVQLFLRERSPHGQGLGRLAHSGPRLAQALAEVGHGDPGLTLRGLGRFRYRMRRDLEGLALLFCGQRNWTSAGQGGWKVGLGDSGGAPAGVALSSGAPSSEPQSRGDECRGGGSGIPSAGDCPGAPAGRGCGRGTPGAATAT